MTVNKPFGENRSPEPITPAALVLQGWRMWQMPLVLGAAWWNKTVAEICWPHDPTCRRPDCKHEDHNELVVPDPIEAEGEHALFA